MSDLESGLAESTNATPSVESSAPQTVDSVFESAAAELSAEPSATPGDPANAVEGAAPTTEAPAIPPTTPEVAEGNEGPIPFKVHKTALENARSKERDEVLAQVQQELAPIAPVLRAITQDVQNGSIDGLKQLMREYAQNPQTAALFRAEMGRALSQMRGQKPPAAEEEPQPDLQTGDGELVYSAKQAAKREQWLMSRMKQDFTKEFAPLRQLHQRVQEAEKVGQMKAQAETTASAAIQHWADQPHFKEHVSAIVVEQKRLFEQGITDPSVSLGKAYLTVLHRDVLPKQQQQSHQSLVSQAAAKVRASTDNPAASAPAQPRRPKSVDDAFDMAIAEVGGRL